MNHSDSASNPNFTIQDIEKLAGLSRLALTQEEKEAFAKDIGGILAYVGQIQEVASSANIASHRTDSANYVIKNIMREDEPDKGTGIELNPNAAILVEAAPQHTEEFVKVKKILAGSQ